MEETGVSKDAPVSFYQKRPSLLTMLTWGGFRFYSGVVIIGRTTSTKSVGHL